MRCHWIFGLAFLAAGLLAAAEPTPDNSAGTADAARHRQHAERVLQQLREQNPDRYRELVKLRETNVEQFRQEMREIVRQRFGERRGGPAGNGGDGPGGIGPGDGNGPPGLFQMDEKELSDRLFRRGLQDRFMEKLQRDEPDTYARLDKLRQKDEDAFNTQLRKVFEERVRQFRGGGQNQGVPIHDVVRRYRDARDDATRERIKGELREQLAGQFDRHMTQRQQMVDQLEERLAQARAAIEERRAARDQLIDEQVADILAGRAPKRPADAPAEGPRRRAQQPAAD